MKHSIDAAKPSFTKRILLYTNERFPLPAIMLFVLLFSFDIFFLGQWALYGQLTTAISLKLILGAISFFLIFFHIRLLDEFKDYEEDCIAHPERLLSKGIVTLSDLKKLLFGVLGLELVVNLIVSSPLQITLWAIIVIYSLLMFKEFFAREFLKKSMWLYLISHQIILPIMILYGLHIATGASVTEMITAERAPLYALFICLLSFTYEIARKTWEPEREHEKADSYTKTWGIKYTAVVLVICYSIIAGLGISFLNWFNLSLSFALINITLFLASIYTVAAFVNKPTKKNSKIVELGGTQALILGHLLFITFSLVQ